ncbi:MAG TPA: alpha/beta hydrolase [Chloroflexota bacterium]|nr:alpha/beta hydrolase [Chloroflexota bacterium]
MATFVLVPGAGGQAWYWHRLTPLLERLGHQVLAIELPAGEESAGIGEYADLVVRAIGERRPIVLVAQSLAGFSAPLVCERVPVELLVLLNAMVPCPGETAGDWWANTGQAAARAAFAVQQSRPVRDEVDIWQDFFHDVPPEVTAEAQAAGPTPQSGKVFGQRWPLDHWPDVPTRFLQARDDRFFPLEFQRRVVGERLGLPVDEIAGGHLVALSQPEALAARLDAYWTELHTVS